MRLELDPGRAKGYRSEAQRVRVLSQAWAEENLYCPACTSRRLDPLREGNPVFDLRCPLCGEGYQLKGGRRAFLHRVVDGAYEPMMRALQEGRPPSFVFVYYIPSLWKVWRVFVVPRYFFSPSSIQRRRGLGPDARRAGWVGCYISLDHLPGDARIPIVHDGRVIPEGVARGLWARFSFLERRAPEDRGWTADVLTCIRDLGKDVFTLEEVYAFEERLAALHPRNRNVRPKIRQQLQVLRDHGILRFLGRGIYRIL